MLSKRCDVASVVGARPQFVKCAVVSRALRDAGLSEILIHTGQHYDDDMSAVFFRELGLPDPDVNLGIGSSSHAQQTAAGLLRIEEVLLERRPRLVLVYGDTNSTLAGALAAVKIGIPVAHIEAGLRSYNRSMPEEINRIATDHWSELLFCHNERTRMRLLGENVRGTIVVVGDVMREALNRFASRALAESPYPGRLALQPDEYAVLTVHRPINADRTVLRNILEWCCRVAVPVVFPTHPRVRVDAGEVLGELDPTSQRVRLIGPVGYPDMVALVARSRLVLTDSGGLQKEAFFLRVPCVTLRGETEWMETVDAGWNVLAGDRPTGADLDQAYRLITEQRSGARPSSAEHELLLDRVFGPPDPARGIVEAVLARLRAN